MKTFVKSMTILAVSALALPALSAGAQPHPGGIAFNGHFANSRIGIKQGVYIADRTTAGVYSTLFFPNATYNPNGWVSPVMGCDNQSYVHGTFGVDTRFGSLQDAGVYAYDPTSGNVTTIARDAVAFGTSKVVGTGALGVQVTQDGDYLIASNIGLYRADGSGTFTTARVGSAFGSPFGLVKDVTTGSIVHLDTAPLFFGSVSINALRYSSDGLTSTLRSLGQLSPLDFPRSWVQQLATGDIIGTGGSISTPGAVLRFNGSSGIATLTTLDFMNGLFTPPPAGTGGCVFENQTLGNPQLICYGTKSDAAGQNRSVKFMFLDPQNSWATTKTLVMESGGGTASTMFCSSAILNARSNYIQTVKTGNLQWDIKLSVPTMGGMNYSLIAGSSGHAPGIAIDSRKIWINPDVLMWATAYNMLGSVFNPGPLVLDANGEAQGSVDLSGLNLPSGAGFLNHLVLLVLDKNAPNGIAFITEPACLKIVN